MNEMEKYNMEKEVEVKEKKHIKIAGITTLENSCILYNL